MYIQLTHNKKKLFKDIILRPTINNINDFDIKRIQNLTSQRKLNLAYNFCVSGYFTVNNVEYNIQQCRQSAKYLYKEILTTGNTNQKREAQEHLDGICQHIIYDLFALFRISVNIPNPFEVEELI